MMLLDQEKMVRMGKIINGCGAQRVKGMQDSASVRSPDSVKKSVRTLPHTYHLPVLQGSTARSTKCMAVLLKVLLLTLPTLKGSMACYLLRCGRLSLVLSWRSSVLLTRCSSFDRRLSFRQRLWDAKVSVAYSVVIEPIITRARDW